MGRQTVFVKSAHSRKSPLRAALFQPIHLVEVDLHHRANRQIQRISNIRMYYPFQSIPVDPIKNCIALLMAEVLSKTLKEEEANPTLFDFLLHTIQALDLNECGTANFHLLFLVHYSRYLGFYPNTEQASEHTWFDARNGNFESMPTASSPLPEYNTLLKQLFGLSFEHLDRLHINRHQRNYLTEYLLKYYSFHVGNFGNVKSFPVLRNVFREM